MTNDQRLINGAILDVLEHLLTFGGAERLAQHLLLIEAARRVNADDEE